MQVQSLGNTQVQAEPASVERQTAVSEARGQSAEDKRSPADATPQSAKAVGHAVDSINQAMKSLANRIEFSIDEDSKRQIVKVIDPDTKEVIRQMPSEEALQIAKALDRLQGLLIKQQA
jgi:flagellar protein FlaG